MVESTRRSPVLPDTNLEHDIPSLAKAAQVAIRGMDVLLLCCHISNPMP